MRGQIGKARFKSLDLTKGEGHEHPDIKENTQYFAKIYGKFWQGTFNREWYGWNFNGWVNHLQYDKPGTNRSDWEEIWEILEPNKEE